jgi:glycosyltransferase involved in cell wall biosynthesis
LSKERGVDHRVDLPGFVSEDVYQDLIRNAAVIALVSSDEGFGLPVAEARFFGIPCIVTSDNGLSQIHEGSVIECEPTPISLANAFGEALHSQTSRPSETSALPTWAGAAGGIRRAMLETQTNPTKM